MTKGELFNLSIPVSQAGMSSQWDVVYVDPPLMWALAFSLALDSYLLCASLFNPALTLDPSLSITDVPPHRLFSFTAR